MCKGESYIRILRLTPHFYYPPGIVSEWKVHLDPIGGMQTQIFRMTTALSKLGIAQKVLTIGMKNAPKTWKINENTEICSSNIPIIPIRSRVRGTVGLNIYWGAGVCLTVISLLLSSLFNKKSTWDLIHSHCSGVAAPLVVGLLSKWILKKPLVYTVHCCRIGTYEPMNSFDRLINKYVVKIEGYCLGNADSVITLTERTKKLLTDSYKNVMSEKVFVIPDIISIEEFNQNINSDNLEHFYRTFGVPGDKPIVSFVGRIAHEKGWKYFLEAVRLCTNKNFHAVFCGDGNEREYLDKMVDKYCLKDRVTITGFIPNSLVAAGIYISDIMVIPSVHEELGSVLLEVASLKKPVIASAVGGLTENITNNVSGMLVEPKSPEMLAESIDFILNNKEIGEKFGVNLYNHVRDNFNEAKELNKIINCYKRLI